MQIWCTGAPVKPVFIHACVMQTLIAHRAVPVALQPLSEHTGGALQGSYLDRESQHSECWSREPDVEYDSVLCRWECQQEKQQVTNPPVPGCAGSTVRQPVFTSSCKPKT